ncbi:MAG: glycosyltransferase family 9 protein [Spirochaetota bacterium]
MKQKKGAIDMRSAPHSGMQILVIKQTSLGDVLHASAFIRAVKKHMPDANIDVVVDKRAAPILADNPYIRKLYIVDVYRWEREAFSSIAGLLRVIRDIVRSIRMVRAKRYDAAFDLQGLFRSVIFLYASRARAKFAKGRWLGVPHLFYRDIHAVEGLLQFLSFIDVPDDGVALDIFLPKDIRRRTERALASHRMTLPRSYLVYAPYSRWQTKDMPMEKSDELLDALAKKFHLPILVCATADYADACRTLASRHARVMPLAGVLSLTELNYVLSQAKGMISVDSYPMHAAAAFDIPLVAVFGPTSEKRIGPRSRRSAVIRAEGIDCARCYKRRCPKAHECMMTIDAAHAVNVLAKCVRLPRARPQRK